MIDFNTFEMQTVAFNGFEAVLFRFDGGFYSTFPPDLIAPELADTDAGFIQLRFDSVSGGPMPAFMGINGTIDTITTPEPSFGALVAMGVLGLSGGAARRRRR